MTHPQTIKSRAAGWAAVLAVAGVLLLADSARASTNNLLLNGNFNAGSTGWTTWANGWANFEIPNKLNPANPAYVPSLVGVYDGTLQLTVGGFGGGWAGAYQIIAATPGVQYTLTVQSGVENWWKPIGEIRLIFLDATNGIITNVTVTTTCAINASCNGSNDVYDLGIPYANWTNVATAPAGTKFLKAEFADPVGTGSVWFDNAYLTAPVDPPVITGLYPDGTRLLQATNKLSFTASSLVPITNSGISVVLNGVDVSGSLVITGPATNRSVSYTGLQSNKVYTAALTVTDTANLSVFKTVDFDTFAPLFTWEAEDYDFNFGQFINNPTPSDAPAAGSYFGLSGVGEIDFHDQAGDGNRAYRTGDAMATDVTGEPTRQKFVDAGAHDYNVGWFNGAGFGGDNIGIRSYDAGEWVNYTRNFPAGTYNIYARLANGNGGTATLPLSKVVSGWGTSPQTTVELGIFRFPANGWGSYAYVPLTDVFGNKRAISLSGTNTLRVTAGSGGNLNFFFLSPVDTDQPIITNVYPDGSTLLQGTNALAFTASSLSHAIYQSNVVVTLNGATVSNLTFAGSSSSWNVSAPLNPDVTNYTALISVTDNASNSHSVTLYFDTFNPACFVVEAEDFDFGGGQFIDNPVVTSNAAPNSYFGKLGQTGVDSSVGDAAPPPTADFRYRELDDIATSMCTDTPMRKHRDAHLTNSLAFNYNVAWWETNAWLNFSRTCPTGKFNVYARLAGNDATAYSIRFDKLSGGTTNYLGTFAAVGRGWNAFDWIPLVNTNTSQMAEVTLGGVAKLRATTLAGNVNPNNFLFVPVVVTPDTLRGSYAAGVLTLSWSNSVFHLQVQTNAPHTGITANWYNYPGGGTSPVNAPVDSTKGSMFFRLSN
jgi:hypothetical protein